MDTVTKSTFMETVLGYLNNIRENVTRAQGCLGAAGFNVETSSGIPSAPPADETYPRDKIIQQLQELENKTIDLVNQTNQVA